MKIWGSRVKDLTGKVITNVRKSYGGLFAVHYCSVDIAWRYNDVRQVPDYYCGMYLSKTNPLETGDFS